WRLDLLKYKARDHGLPLPLRVMPIAHSCPIERHEGDVEGAWEPRRQICATWARPLLTWLAGVVFGEFAVAFVRPALSAADPYDQLRSARSRPGEIPISCWKRVVNDA